MKSCKKGYYYCNTDKKCKPIPEGSVLRDDGFLMKETLDEKDKPFVKKLVKKLRGGSKTHAKQADDLEKAMKEEKHGDHEPEMIRNQLKTAGRASKRIVKHSRKKDNFKAWVQSKITKASDYLDTAADYLDSKEVKEAVNPAQQAAIAIAKRKKIEGDMVAKKEKQQKIMSSYDWRSQLESELGHVDECWKTHKKVGMKMKGGKLVPNCVPKNEEYIKELSDETMKSYKEKANNQVKKRLDGIVAVNQKLKVKKLPKENENQGGINIVRNQDGPGGNVIDAKDRFKKNNKIDEAKSPAWQRKAGKSESGGLNKKGVASYRAANPGSKLKTAVTTKPSKLKKGSKAANRRKSFCARMKGMKKRLTSAKTARDPDSRINKSLRKWNC